MTAVSRGIDRIEVTFDEPNLVANAGLVLVATLVVRLGLERLINATVDLSGRVGGARPGRKVLTLVHAMAAGGPHIDHADMLRSGATEAVLAHRVMAPSTLGTFSVLHLRPYSPVGPGARRDAAPGVGPRGGTGIGPARHRPRLHHLRGVRQGQTRRGLWIYEDARLPPPIVVRAWTGRSSTFACAKVRPTPSVGPSVSWRSSWPWCAGPGPPEN